MTGEIGNHERGSNQCPDIKTVKDVTLPDLVKQLGDLKERVAQLPEILRRLEKAEDRIEEGRENIAKLYTGLGETKVLVNQILDKLDGLETKIFSYMTQAIEAASIRDKDKSGGLNKDLIDLLKFVIAGTIIAIVTALFIKGGIKL
jgi:chromosome segregation ATPase